MVVPMRCKKKQDDCKNDDDKQDSLCEKVSYAFKNVADEVKHRLPPLVRFFVWKPQTFMITEIV